VEILKQFGILWSHVACPEDLGTVNIGAIKDSLVENEIVVGTLAHNHQMVAWRLLKLA